MRTKLVFILGVMLSLTGLISSCTSKQDEITALYPNWKLTRDSVFVTYKKLNSNYNFTNKSVLTMAESHIYSRHLDTTIQNNLSVYEKKQQEELLNQTILQQSFLKWVNRTEKIDSNLQLAMDNETVAKNLNLDSLLIVLDTLKVQYRAYQIKIDQSFSTSSNTDKAFSDLLNSSIAAYNRKAQGIDK